MSEPGVRHHLRAVPDLGTSVTHAPSDSFPLGMTRSSAWSDAIAAYTTAMRAESLAAGTIRLHRYYLGCLARWFPSPWAVTTSDLRHYLAAHAWKPETRKSARSALRAFYRWAHLEQHVDADPADRLRPVKVPAGVPRPTPEDVLTEALATAAPREELMLRLAAYGGLRCCEIARVHRDDYDAATGLLTVSGKGGKTRVVPVVEPNLSVMLLEVEGWAFPSRATGGPLTAGHVTKLLSQALPGRWTGHTLRHRMGTRALAATRDHLAVGKVLGHSRPETTQRYCEVADDRLRAAAAGAA